jgi:hypothetical protein
MGTDFRNLVSTSSDPKESVDSDGMLDNAVWLRRWTSVIVNVDLKLGSSKQGNALLASVGWNFVVAMNLVCPDLEST